MGAEGCSSPPATGPALSAGRLCPSLLRKQCADLQVHSLHPGPFVGSPHSRPFALGTHSTLVLVSVLGTAPHPPCLARGTPGSLSTFCEAQVISPQHVRKDALCARHLIHVPSVALIFFSVISPVTFQNVKKHKAVVSYEIKGGHGTSSFLPLLHSPHFLPPPPNSYLYLRKNNEHQTNK